MKKFIVYIGNYGSGKTEISINTAINENIKGKKTLLLDMDIVNPYFRASEHKKMLESKGIDIVMPYFANTLVDVPSLPPDIFKAFDGNYDTAVFDAGGDPVGAAALGILKNKFYENISATDVFYVVNTMRPLQSTEEDIITMLRQIEDRSSLKVTGLVNNTNIALETTEDMVLKGQKILNNVSMETGIPVTHVYVMNKLKNKLAVENSEVVGISLYMRPDWIDVTK